MTVPLRQAAGDQAGDKDLGRRNRALGLLVGDPVNDRARPDYPRVLDSTLSERSIFSEDTTTGS